MADSTDITSEVGRGGELKTPWQRTKAKIANTANAALKSASDKVKYEVTLEGTKDRAKAKKYNANYEKQITEYRQQMSPSLSDEQVKELTERVTAETKKYLNPGLLSKLKVPFAMVAGGFIAATLIQMDSNNDRTFSSDLRANDPNVENIGPDQLPIPTPRYTIVEPEAAEPQVPSPE